MDQVDALWNCGWAACRAVVGRVVLDCV